MSGLRRVWLLLAIINIAGIFLLRHYDTFYRTIPIKNFDELCIFQKTLQQPPGMLPPEIMQEVMNTNVKGKNCNDMSELFLKRLLAQGYRARKLFVVKSIGDPYATHTLVEVFENNKWVIYDPTFNVSFKKEEQLLSSTDISKSLVDGSFKKIEPIFYGEVAYPARLETYPIYWLVHFNNVLMFKYGNYSSSWFVRNTIQLITRYWQGPVLYYFAPTGNPNDYLELINWFYFIFTCLLPLSLLLLGVIILSLIIKPSFQNKLQ